MAEEFRVLRPREYHTQLVLKGQRADGRKLEEVRDLKLETNAIRTADSSSLVKLGNTSLVCGCIALLVRNQDKDNGGEEEIIRIKVNMPPICLTQTTNRSQHTAQLLTKTLNNILNDSGCLDKRSFYIDELDLHWSVDVEVICLNYDGCLLDAAMIAILSALKSLALSSTKSNSTPKIDTMHIKFNSLPICLSFAIIGDRIICDPDLEEETIAQSVFTLSINATNDKLCHVNKVGGKSLSNLDLMKCIQLAKERSSEVKKSIDKVEKNVNEEANMSIDDK